MKAKHFIAMMASCSIFCISVPAYATHSWNGYHWARTNSPFDLTVVNSTTADWDPYVAQATSDWSSPTGGWETMLQMVQDLNGGTDNKTRRHCRPDKGTVRICNLKYGQNGWLGIAGISIDTNGHIVSGYTKLNDTYFDFSYYNTDDWKQSVTCQELGHDIGLDHQDEDFNNAPLFTCMDYQDPPYPHPNDHDYEELEIIYGHTDSYDSYAGADSGGGGGGCNAPPGKGCNKFGSHGETGWGLSLGRRGNSETFVRIDPNGITHLTHVTWANGY